MRIAQINMTPLGSTGKIMLNVARTARKQGHEAISFTTDMFSVKGKQKRVETEGLYYYGFYYDNMLHNYLGKLLGANGRLSYLGTRQLIHSLKKFSPDIVHLHNLHSHCINLPLLFRYLRKHNIRVVWTLHDCWAFTGHCPYFTMAKCDRWQNGCHHCPQLKSYPKSYLDTSKKMYRLKKKWFTSVQDMTIVTPSQWLADLAKQSFLKEYPVKVIHNGIDLCVFKPTSSDFRERHQIAPEKKILLGVAFDWGKRKGLDVFIELAKRLPDDYQIMLVGTNDAVDQQLPANIISIHRTQDQVELAQIYTAANVFLNPTREENYPTVNMEALACGTPVITFKTGGSPEIPDSSCGSVVECDDVDAMLQEIYRISKEQPYGEEACLARAKEFDMNDRFRQYVQLYQEMTAQ